MWGGALYSYCYTNLRIPQKYIKKCQKFAKCLPWQFLKVNSVQTMKLFCAILQAEKSVKLVNMKIEKELFFNGNFRKKSFIVNSI